MQTYLVAYRNTTHPSTGVCPSELLFRLKLHTKLPELQEAVKLDGEVRDRDNDRKAKMKDYADRRRHAEESTLTEGDKVLLKQQRVNKWTPQFENQPYEVVDKRGNSVLVESPDGVQYKRNTTHVKPYHKQDHAEQLPEETSTSQVEEEEKEDRRQVAVDQADMERSQEDESRQMLEDVPPSRSPWPMRMRCIPKRFDDYVMG